MNNISILDQLEQATHKKNRLAFAFAAPLAGIIPFFSWWLIHFEVSQNPLLWLVAIGGLIYSAITVFSWGKTAFQSGIKSFGFVLLLEGILTFSVTLWVSIVSLGFLIVINAIATSTNLVLDKKSNRAAIRATAPVKKKK